MMTKKRALADAVKDPLLDKPKYASAESKQKRKNHVAVKILVSLALGFAGGLTASRWIKIF
jgi:hypothetical protein